MFFASSGSFVVRLQVQMAQVDTFGHFIVLLMHLIWSQKGSELTSSGCDLAKICFPIFDVWVLSHKWAHIIWMLINDQGLQLLQGLEEIRLEKVLVEQHIVIQWNFLLMNPEIPWPVTACVRSSCQALRSRRFEISWSERIPCWKVKDQSLGPSVSGWHSLHKATLQSFEGKPLSQYTMLLRWPETSTI